LLTTLFMRNWSPLVTSADKKGHGDIGNVIYGQVCLWKSVRHNS